MKGIKFIFPLMFVAALAGSAFTRQTQFAKTDFVLAYYEDQWQDNCYSAQLVDGKCVVDPADYICMENILGRGAFVMYQSTLPGICYQPYYSYTP